MGLNKYNIEKNLQYRIWFQNDKKKPSREKGNIVKYGYTCYSDHYDAVLYLQNGVISYFPTSQNFDCISFGFSGCYMARFSLGNKLFIAHIPPDTKDYWNKFVHEHQRDKIIGCIFNPTDMLKCNNESGSYPGNKVWGIITSQNRCIALRVYEGYEIDFDGVKHSCKFKQIKKSNIDMSSIIRKKMPVNENLYI